MAYSAQAAKCGHQAFGRRARNMSMHSKLRTEITRASRPIVIGGAEQAAAACERARPIIDSMAGKGKIHRNTAARHKSSLNKRLKALSAE